MIYFTDLCTIVNLQEDDNGEKIIVATQENVECRLYDKASIIYDGNGKKVLFSSIIHMEDEIIIRKGDQVTVTSIRGEEVVQESREVKKIIPEALFTIARKAVYFGQG